MRVFAAVRRVKAVYAAQTVGGGRWRKCAETRQLSGGEALSCVGEAPARGGGGLFFFDGSGHFQSLGEQRRG